jgi:hypothetical protein
VISEWKYLIFMVTTLICNKGFICDVNGIQETNACCWISYLIYVITTNICPILVVDTRVLQPPASTSGETLFASQVFSKGPVVRVLLVHC